MASVLSAIRNTVPINFFNRGLAGKVFEEVKKSGAKVVLKNNTPECVLLSPEEYVQLTSPTVGTPWDSWQAVRLRTFLPQNWQACLKG